MQLPPLSQLMLTPALKRKFIHAGAALTLTSSAAQASPPARTSRFMRCVPLVEMRSEAGPAAETRHARPGKDSPWRWAKPSERSDRRRKKGGCDVFRRTRPVGGEKGVFG